MCHLRKFDLFLDNFLSNFIEKGNDTLEKKEKF